MNILLHTHEFNIKEGGPCTKRIDSLAKYLQSSGHKVTIITSSHNKTNEIIDRQYEIVYSYSTKTIKKSNLYRLLNNLLFGITSFFKTLITIKKVDVVVTTSPPPLISIFGYAIAKCKNAKVVYDVRDIWPDVALEMESFKKGSIYEKIFSFIAKFMYKHSYLITTVSPRKVEKLKKYCIDEKKVKYISNGFDDELTHFEIDDKVIEKYELKQKFTTVYIGNVGLAQNIDAFIELAACNEEDSNMQFLIFGDGVYKQKIETEIRERNLKNVKLAGKIEYSKVRTILTYAKISFISLKNNSMLDSIPTKMFDSLGIGCPTLLMASGDACDILEKSKLGEIAKNLEELKEKFSDMTKNYEKYIENKEYSIKYIQQEFSRKEIAKQFETEVIKIVI